MQQDRSYFYLAIDKSAKQPCRQPQPSKEDNTPRNQSVELQQHAGSH